MATSPFSNVYGFFTDLHTFLIFLNAFKDWNTISAAYKAVSLSRSDVYRKVKALRDQGFLISRDEDNKTYYRIPSTRIKIVGFGEIDLTDSPVIHVYIDQYGRFLEKVRRNDVQVLYIGENND